jgi:hypothetical protein
MTTDFRALCAELVAAWLKGDDIFGPMARARLALAQPKPVRPTDDDLLHIFYLHCDSNNSSLGIDHWLDEQAFLMAARDALQTWGRPAIAHIPVAERLPGPEDLDDQGTCWMWNPICLYYCLCRPDPSVHTHWLPFHALPLPEGGAA